MLIFGTQLLLLSNESIFNEKNHFQSEQNDTWSRTSLLYVLILSSHMIMKDVIDFTFVAESLMLCNVFSCEGAALEVLIYFCLSVRLSVRLQC